MDLVGSTLVNIGARRMQISYTSEPVEAFIRKFTGREGMPGYDAAKPITIGDTNREFVWDLEKQQGLIRSVFIGYPMPALLVVNSEIPDSGQRSTTLHRFMNDAFSVEFEGVVYKYSTMTEQNPRVWMKWHSYHVSVTYVTGATPEQAADIFENFNNGTNLTTGQRMWARKDTPLVKMALKLTGQLGELPFQDDVARAWRRRAKMTKPRNELSLAFQIIVGSQHGPAHLHTKWSDHLPRIRNTLEDQIDLTNLREIIKFVSNVDTDNKIHPNRKKSVFEKFISAIIHDFHTIPDIWRNKWTRFLNDAYNLLSNEQLVKLREVGVSRANSMGRVKALAANVQVYLDEKVIPDAGEEDDVYNEDEEDDDADIDSGFGEDDE